MCEKHTRTRTLTQAYASTQKRVRKHVRPRSTHSSCTKWPFSSFCPAETRHQCKTNACIHPVPVPVTRTWLHCPPLAHAAEPASPPPLCSTAAAHARALLAARQQHIERLLPFQLACNHARSQDIKAVLHCYRHPDLIEDPPGPPVFAQTDQARCVILNGMFMTSALQAQQMRHCRPSGAASQASSLYSTAGPVIAAGAAEDTHGGDMIGATAEALLPGHRGVGNLPLPFRV